MPDPEPCTSALVLFSGGQDSTVCLAAALAHYSSVETVGFDYGQRHAVELQQRTAVIKGLRDQFPDWAKKLGPDHLLALPELGRISHTALTRDAAITFSTSGLPTTFVPGRNIVFFTFAAALAYRRGIATLVGGMCETDYSGYPDCRNATLQSLARTLSLGLDRPIAIETPLMWKTKAATWAMAHALGGAGLVDLIVAETHTCYLGDRVQAHVWGRGCGACPACRLRAIGWEQWRGGEAPSRDFGP